MSIEFTPEELQKLTVAAREGAAAIAKTWDILAEISTRIGRDWSPSELSVSELFDELAANLESPERAAEAIMPADIAECFNDEQDWETAADSSNPPLIDALLAISQTDGQ